MPNELVHETSPYLLQHAHNPVEWIAWGPQAFERARTEDKPVFLSVGYSTCHWCHVMERESFENEAVAAVMNRCFVNVKVDREERPDVDATYMAFVQAATGHGGWPMSVWLTPDGLPLAGGTYFPPFDRDGRPGFAHVCEEIARVWHSDRARATASAAKALEHLRRAAAPRPPSHLPASAFDDFIDTAANLFDDSHGGFGGAPKFPRPVVLRALFQLAERHSGSGRAERARDMAIATLRAMAAGGIHDQLGGGFHRYSVDRRWHIPHYEKMLYDQALLAHAYLDAWQVSGDPEMRTTAESILAYAIDELRDPAGGFHAAEDADSRENADDTETREGAFWTWRARELVKLLDPREAAWFATAYGVGEAGNAAADSDPHGELAGRNTLRRAMPDASLAARFGVAVDEVTAVLSSARTKLLAARAKRPRPHRDDKVVAAWNGLLLGALARSARILTDPRHAAAAGDLARFLREQMWDGSRLARTWRAGQRRVDAFAADYAGVIHGFIEWHGFDGDPATLAFATTLQEAMEEHCRAPGRTGYVMCARTGDTGLWDIEDDHDGAEPAANHLAADNLLRLSALTGDARWSSRAGELLAGCASTAGEHPFSAPVALAAFDLRERGVIKIEARGTPAPPLPTLLGSTHLPRAVWTRSDGPGDVIVCSGHTCLPPVRDPESWRNAFRDGQNNGNDRPNQW